MKLVRSHKACRKCHHLIPKKQSICPACGGDSFSDRWRGLIILMDKDSYVCEVMDLEREGYYAVKVL